MATLHALTTYQPTLAPDLLCTIAQGYQGDVLFREWLADPSTPPGVTVHDHNSYQLLLIVNCLCIPDINNLREDLMQQAHEGTAAHLGLGKTLEILRDGYFWDSMSKNTHEFIHACHSCQQANAPMKKPAGPLHPLPIPCDKFDDITMNFIGPLPSSGRYDYLLTITDCLTGFIEFVPCLTTLMLVI